MMEWKPYYDAELRRPESRTAILGWLRKADPATEQCVQEGDILSFPHTALAYAGPLHARVVSGLYRTGVQRVIALGVLHGSLVPEFRLAMDDGAAADERADAFQAVSGAHVPVETGRDTPFGHVRFDAIESRLPDALRVDEKHLLRQEFSLDTFLAVLRLGGDAFDSNPLPVLPLYVGMTRHPVTGSFDAARRLSDTLRSLWTPGTAIVTTGDVVHYGAVYGSPKEDLSTDQLTRRSVETVHRLLHTALKEDDYEAAYQQSLEPLRSDQREILPVLASLLGANAGATVLDFHLSDYAGIFDVPPPCRVASALIAYHNRSGD